MIYHYTSVENFIKIIESKELYLFNAFNMNDNLEINWINSLRLFSLVMKNPSFMEEKEIRLIHVPLITMHKKTYEIQMIGNISPLYFMKKNHGISSYFKYSLKGMFDYKLIPEIILGPKCNINISDLELFLLSNNLSKTKIIRSKASYR